MVNFVAYFMHYSCSTFLVFYQADSYFCYSMKLNPNVNENIGKLCTTTAISVAAKNLLLEIIHIYFHIYVRNIKKI